MGGMLFHEDRLSEGIMSVDLSNRFLDISIGTKIFYFIYGNI